MDDYFGYDENEHQAPVISAVPQQHQDAFDFSEAPSQQSCISSTMQTATINRPSPSLTKLAPTRKLPLLLPMRRSSTGSRRTRLLVALGRRRSAYKTPSVKRAYCDIDAGAGVAGQGGPQSRGEATARGIPRPQGTGEDREGCRKHQEGGDQQVRIGKAERRGRVAQSHKQHKCACG